MRVAIFTAVFGGYDELKEPPLQDVECDFICFTDASNAKLESAWRIVRVPHDRAVHPRMRAKRYKLMSHEVFPKGRLALRYGRLLAPSSWLTRYDATIWVDASLLLRHRSFARDIVGFIGKTSWAMFTHPDRDCFFEEAIVSSGMNKYRGFPIREQASHYSKVGILPHSGLYACGVVARKEPLTPMLRRANELWWSENVKWSYQDQLSLPFVLHQLGIGVDQIPGNLWRNDWFDWIPRESDC